MDFRIADTFTDSLAPLTVDERKAAKLTAFELQVSPASPGLNVHQVARTRDKGFHSARVSDDICLIFHRSGADLLLCYVDHHDKAYDWAVRRKLEPHPETGAAQLVEIREVVREVVVPTYVPGKTAPGRGGADGAPPLAGVSEGDLLRYGVPPEWVDDVRSATEWLTAATSRR